MRNLILIGLGLATITLFNSCKKGGFKTSSDRIMGEWTFEKVKFHEGGTFRNINITDEFEDITIEFTNDFEYIESNGADGSIRNGIWEIKNVSTSYGENAGTKFSETMTCPIYVPSTGLIDFIEWEDLSITRNRIQAVEHKTGGTYQYWLRRD